MTQSIAMRLSIAFGLIAAIIFSVSGLALYHALARNLNNQLDSDLRSKLEITARMVNSVGSLNNWEELKRGLITTTSADEYTRYWISCADDAFKFGAPLTNLDHQELTKSIQLVSEEGSPHPMKTLGMMLKPLKELPEILLVVGVSTANMQTTLSGFASSLVIINCTGILLVAALGYWISGNGLKPVVYLSEAAKNITAKTIDHRLSLALPICELSPLVASFNGALERVESAYSQLECFCADVAHELRTPIGNMIVMSQVMLTRERTADELHEALVLNLEELQRLSSIVNDMLFLARADRGERVNCSVPVQIRNEVEKTVEFLAPLFEEKELRIEVIGSYMLAIDAALLRRALSNLLHNAIQHSDRGSKITVTICSIEKLGSLTISVANFGTPIAADQIMRLFDRFYKGDASRALSKDNHGLGLAIVKAVALMHGGSTFARSANGVNTFGIHLPD